MAERVRIEHEFNCSEQTFWDLFLSEEYNQALFQGYLKFPLWRVATAEERNGTLHRSVEVEPYVVDLPGPIKKVVGDSIRYQEIGQLERAPLRYTVKVVPAKLADKLFVSGVQRTEPLGPHTCRRIFEATVEVKIFGVGGLIEKRIVQDLTKSYDLGAKFTNRYIAEKGLS